jgi:hypothetical protein
MKLKTYNIVERHNSELDTERWDACVEKAVNSRVYAHSWYLDAVYPDWHGIVVGNYDYVMPICPAKKWGFSYLLQPVYSQQLGIFPAPTPDLRDSILLHILKKYKYIDINLNAMNLMPTELEIHSQWKPNHLLSLQADCATLQGHYSSHCKRHVRKAKKQFEVANDLNVEDFMKLKTSQANRAFTPKHRNALQRIISKSKHQGNGIIYGAYTPHNELCAAAFVLATPKRLVYLNGTSTEQGHSNGAMYALIDRLIADHAQLPLLLDFEGSAVPGIARFFEGFGAQPERYPHLYINQIPNLLKFWKRWKQRP